LGDAQKGEKRGNIQSREEGSGGGFLK